MKTISILGTGWLGLFLAKQSQKEFHVKVSIRNIEKEESLKAQGFDTFILNEEDYSSLDNLLNTDYLFVNFPPSKSKDYLGFLKTIYEHKNIKNIKKIFFISSTSIYPKENAIYKEDLEIKAPSSTLVYEAEKLIEAKTNVIFRCSGLMGGDRIAGKYFAGKVTKGANAKTNYIHRNDIVEAIFFAIKEDLKGIYNLCAPNHPSRKEVYSENALKCSFEKPIFEGKIEFENRIIDGSKIEKKGFKYKYPNPLDFN